MKTPHKHAELIKAWADGAKIQRHDNAGWLDLNGTPTWTLTSSYRIKPEPQLSEKATQMIDSLLELQHNRYMICGDSLDSSSAVFASRFALEDYILSLEQKA